MYNITVNSGDGRQVESNEQGALLIDGEALEADISKLAGNRYHVISNHRSYNVEVIDFDATNKTARISVNGVVYELTARDRFDLLLEQMGMANINSLRVADLKAPMPGLVLKVFVNEGDKVDKGDNLFVLEAMKMENIIKAPAAAIINKIRAQPGDAVEKGEVLIIFQ